MTGFKENPTLVIKAEIHLRSANELGENKGISEGFSASVFYNGNRYPSKVVDCESPIMPSSKGQVILYMIDTFPERSGISSGAKFELKYGVLTVAKGNVLSVSELTD